MNKTRKINSVVLVVLLAFAFCFGLVSTIKTVFFKGYAGEEPFMVSLNVGKDISFKFTADVPEDASDVSMNFQWTGLQAYDKTYTSLNTENYTDNGDGTITFTYRGITPQNMGKDIIAKLSYTEKDSTTPTTKSVTTSVKSYCEKLISSTAEELNLSEESDTQVKKLAVDILNYGAAAQTYKGIDTENLVNAGKTGGSNFTDFSANLENKKYAPIDNGIVAWSRGIYFDYNVNPMIKFNLSDTLEVGSLTSKIEMDGEEVETPTPVATTDGKYQVIYKDFNILDIDKEYTITIYNGQTEIGSYKDSVASIVYSQKDAKDDNAMANLMKTMYTYGKSVELYADTFNTVNSYRFEGETANLTCTNTSTINYDVLQDCRYLGFDLRFSECLSLRNLNSGAITYKFKFNSDREITSDLVMVVSVNNGITALSKIISSLKVNDIDISISDISVAYNNDLNNSIAWGVCAENPTKTAYMHYDKATIKIPLQKGENIITFKYQGNGGNLDYIELKDTQAKISGYQKTSWNKTTSIWTVTTQPTENSTGILYVSSPDYTDKNGDHNYATYTLPILSEENGYTLEETENEKIYSFNLFGTKYEFKVNK